MQNLTCSPFGSSSAKPQPQVMPTVALYNWAPTWALESHMQADSVILLSWAPTANAHSTMLGDPIRFFSLTHFFSLLNCYFTFKLPPLLTPHHQHQPHSPLILYPKREMEPSHSNYLLSDLYLHQPSASSLLLYLLPSSHPRLSLYVGFRHLLRLP